MTTAPSCIFCKHLNTKSNKYKQFCSAFPEKIPDLIWSASNSHQTSFEGDNGIIFEDNGGLVELDGMKK